MPHEQLCFIHKSAGQRFAFGARSPSTKPVHCRAETDCALATYEPSYIYLTVSHGSGAQQALVESHYSIYGLAETTEGSKAIKQ